MTKIAKVQDIVCEGITPQEMDAVRGLVWTMRSIESQTGYGSIHISVTNGIASEFDVQQRIRPSVSAPWKGQKP